MGRLVEDRAGEWVGSWIWVLGDVDSLYFVSCGCHLLFLVILNDSFLLCGCVCGI